MTKAVAYYRVSTEKQGRSGLGLEAQADAVKRHLGPKVDVLASYTETESGRADQRPELRKALDHCKRSGASLCVAKLDRLARSARFLSEILGSGVEVEFADLPQVSGPQGKFLLTSMAAVAELEAGLISERTKAALKAAKARGVRLGNPNGTAVLAKHRAKACRASAKSRAQTANDRAEAWRSTVESMLSNGMSNTTIARTLNANSETSVSGGTWTATGVRRLLARLKIDTAAMGANPGA